MSMVAELAACDTVLLIHLMQEVGNYWIVIMHAPACGLGCWYMLLLYSSLNVHVCSWDHKPKIEVFISLPIICVLLAIVLMEFDIETQGNWIIISCCLSAFPTAEIIINTLCTYEGHRWPMADQWPEAHQRSWDHELSGGPMCKQQSVRTLLAAYTRSGVTGNFVARKFCHSRD
jgi:hypothetical protein